jgi:hypothetical protein
MAREEREPKKKSSVGRIFLNLIALAAIAGIGWFAYNTWMETYPTPDNPEISGDFTDDDIRQLREVVPRLSRKPILRFRRLSPTTAEVHVGVIKSAWEGGGGEIFEFQKQGGKWEQVNANVTRKWTLGGK